MDPSLQDRLQDLGDLELALLISMVAEEHCIFSTDQTETGSLHRELELTCMETFGIQPVLIECSPEITVDEFNEALLVETDEDLDEMADRGETMPRARISVNFTSIKDQEPGRLGSIGNKLDERRIADVIIATGLDTADESVQVQAFELLRSRRIFTRAAMHVAPKDLLFIVVLSKPDARLFRHLNDIFCLSHFHGEGDGLPHLDSRGDKPSFPSFGAEDIQHLRTLTSKISITAEMAQYVHNVVVFMRNSRYIKGGVTATATRQLRILSRALAPLHGLDYVPPSLVALAARKIYPHRLVLATTESEKSLLWGSDPEAVKELLEGLTVEDAIEDVLASIEAPL